MPRVRSIQLINDYRNVYVTHEIHNARYAYRYEHYVVWDGTKIINNNNYNNNK